MPLHTILLNVGVSPNPFVTYCPIAIAAVGIGVQIYWNRKTVNQSQENSEQQLNVLQKQLADQNENAFKYSSIQIATKMDEDFDNLERERTNIGRLLIGNHWLDEGLENNFYQIRDQISNVLDVFDTVGYFVKHEYIKAEVAHQYFYYWFTHYYEFFKRYEIRKLSKREHVIWNNLPRLLHDLNIVETAQRHNQAPPKIEKEDLIKFFKEEAGMTSQ